jgi:short-subunit dehydrogenase
LHKADLHEVSRIMSRRSIEGIRALVTGASSGIGRELALQLARQGAHLVLTARRQTHLEDLVREIGQHGGQASAVAGDVTDPALRQRLAQVVADQWSGLDLLVNNAGVGAVGPFADADSERLRRVMEVNFFAPAELIRELLPLLRSGRRPMIVNVGSVLGHRAVPNKSEYCASKFALHGLTDALRAELDQWGIDMLLVSPSTTRTEFAANVLERRAHAPRPPFESSARSVARQTLRAIRRGSHEIIISPGGKLLVWLDRLCPPLADRLIARFGK